jgi:hypothetical protein
MALVVSTRSDFSFVVFVRPRLDSSWPRSCRCKWSKSLSQCSCGGGGGGGGRGGGGKNMAAAAAQMTFARNCRRRRRPHTNPASKVVAYGNVYDDDSA